ncbi:MAG: glycosyltransferase family 4 protein [Thermoplasmata archaeon]
MKILFAFGDTGSGYSGGDILVYRLANHLASKHEVHFVRLVSWRRAIGAFLDPELLARSQEGRSLRSRVYDGLSRRSVLKGFAGGLDITPTQKAVWPLSPSICITNFDGKLALPNGFDHAIATSWMTAFFVDRRIDARKKHYLIQNFEDSPIYSGGMSALVTPAYSLDLHKVVISEALRSRFERDNPSVVTPGVDRIQFHRVKSFESRSPYSLILPLKAGAYKGTREGYLAASLSHARHPDLTLSTFGNKYAASMAGVQSSKWCRILHNPTTRVLVDSLNSARYLVFPSAVEGFPVAPLEAMACGGLVISTPNTGIAAYLIDGQNGFVARGFDSKSIHEAIERAFAEEADSARMLAQASDTTRRYTWERTYEMFTEALVS